jgi:cell division protease FtsH
MANIPTKKLVPFWIAAAGILLMNGVLAYSFSTSTQTTDKSHLTAAKSITTKTTATNGTTPAGFRGVTTTTVNTRYGPHMGAAQPSSSASYASADNAYPFVYAPSHTRYAPLTEFYKDVSTHQVKNAAIDTTLSLIYFETTAKKSLLTYFTAGTAASIQSMLLAGGANIAIANIVTAQSPYVLASAASIAWTPLLALLMTFAFIAFFQIRRARQKRQHYQQGGAPKSFATARSQAGASTEARDKVEVPTTRFSDVAGCEEAVADLAEFVEFLKSPQRFEAVGATMPKGALLSGPPGTGKTLLARAVAGEAGVPFFAASGSDFAEIYVGVGPKRVRELFAKARKSDKAIIFIDEIDAIAKKRSDGPGNSDSERESTLIALLNEMDGFHDSKIIVLAATNRPDILDPAITRPGRLDRRVEVPLPDRRGREKILSVHAAKRPLSRDVDLEQLARRTSGMSGAELAQVVNEACIEAARAHDTAVTARHFDAAVAQVAMGRARHSALVPDADRLVTAWHEAGHTVCAYVQDAADKPVSVSIIPRGPAGGVTWMSEGDEVFMQRSKASARLVTALGGRAAEELLLGDDFTQGAYGDLTTATQLATAMATQYGMTGLGLVVRDPKLFGESAATGVTEHVEAMLVSALDEARAILETHRPFVEALVAGLLDNDTLIAEEIEAIYRASTNSAPTHPRSIIAGISARAAQPVPMPVASVIAVAPVAPTAPARAASHVIMPDRPTSEASIMDHLANIASSLYALGVRTMRSRSKRQGPPRPSMTS